MAYKMSIFIENCWTSYFSIQGRIQDFKLGGRT